MAKCTYCGSETELYSSNIPVCVKCSKERDGKRKPDDRYTRFAEPRIVPEDLKRSG